jgi:excisionase family DNA binding protein
MWLSVPEAADRLALDAGRVRRMLADGVLAGRKVGGRWLIDDGDVAARLDTHSRAGRPLSARSAWGLLWAADRRSMPWLAPRERARACQRAAGWPIEDWSWACRHRAEVHRYRAHASVIAALAGDARMVRSGVSAREVGVDLYAPDVAELYVPARDLAAVVVEFVLIPSEQANVTLRVPPEDLWLFDDMVEAPWPVVAVDLVDAGDDRSIRAARDLAQRLGSL